MSAPCSRVRGDGERQRFRGMRAPSWRSAEGRRGFWDSPRWVFRHHPASTVAPRASASVSVGGELAPTLRARGLVPGSEPPALAVSGLVPSTARSVSAGAPLVALGTGLGLPERTLVSSAPTLSGGVLGAREAVEVAPPSPLRTLSGGVGEPGVRAASTASIPASALRKEGGG